MNNQPARILIIDDEPDIREFVSYNLSRRGYIVETAADGKEGYEMALTFRPDLIILDILMPVMNGYETCIRLRRNPEFSSTRILFLSALNESYARELGIKLEVDGYISKPVRMELLLRRIDTWVRKAG
ncbi:MAG: PleD family two-component system response regulator [Bacteroidota bacterium]|jgi:two-component system alkaline phosphatase synthesis response regulator PhoP